MVHEVLVTELAFIFGKVVDAVPRFDAYEWGMLAVWTPDADGWCAEVERYGWLVFFVEQRNGLYLTLVEDYRIVLETILGEFPNRVLRLNFMMSGDDTPSNVAKDALNGLVVMKIEFALQWFARFCPGYAECRVTAYLEVNLLGVGVMNMPDDVDGVLLQTVGDAEHESVWVLLHCLFRVFQYVCQAVVGLTDEFKLGVAGKSVTLHIECLSLGAILSLP